MSSMQSDFLADDFDDEYVAACLVELGLQPALTLDQEKSEKNIAVTAVNALIAWEKEPGNAIKAAFARETIGLMKESLSRNRASGLAEHCNKFLFRFVSAAHDSQVDLERHRIGLKFRQAEAEITDATTRGLEAFEKAIKTCESVEEPNAQSKCMAAALKITETSGKKIELGQVTTIATATEPEGLTLASYYKAKTYKITYDKKIKGIDSNDNKLPDDVKDDMKIKKSILEKERKNLENEKNILSMDLDKYIDKGNSTEKENTIIVMQGKRAQLKAVLISIPESETRKRRDVEIDLEKQRLDEKKIIERYADLLIRMRSLVLSIDSHIKKVDQLIKENQAPTN